MKKMKTPLLIVMLIVSLHLSAQPDRIKSIFPAGTQFLQNIPYANDTLKKHLLDIYIPPNARAINPVVVWVHGGAWMLNDKYADMGYMTNTIKSIIEKGYVLASIDYRHSTTAIFPAQIQDCNQALEFLHNNASKYKLDKTNIVLFGFSAGGHLASLLALSNNNTVTDFYPQKKKTSFKIKAVIDFYGPSDFLAMTAMGDPEMKGDPISTLLGSTPLKRPDISKTASPSTYVDKGDPPFIIVHGEKDESVPYQQSVLLQSYLNLAGVKNELVIVKGAPHYGTMFDTDEVKSKLFEFLALNFK